MADADGKREQPKYLTNPTPAASNLGWFNEITGLSWKYINAAVVNFVENEGTDKINAALGRLEGSISITSFSMGAEPLKLSGVTLFDSAHNSEIAFDLDFEYDGKPIVEGKFSIFPFGIKDVQFSGRIRVLVALLPVIPVIGGISLFFVHEPKFDFDLTGLANVADFYLVRDAIDRKLSGLIRDNMVLPNRQVLSLDATGQTLDECLLKYPYPKALLYITVVNVANVEDEDYFSGGSDVYVHTTISGNQQEFWTTVKDNVTRKVVDFGERFDVLLEEYEDVLLHFNVLDKDKGKSDDELGQVSINLSSIREMPKLTVPLANTNDKATITVDVQQLVLRSDASTATPVLDAMSGEALASYVLAVRLLRVDNLVGKAIDGTELEYTCSITVQDQPPVTTARLYLTSVDETTFHQLPEESRQLRFLLKNTDGTASLKILSRQFDFESVEVRIADLLQDMGKEDTFAVNDATMKIQFKLFGLVSTHD